MGWLGKDDDCQFAVLKSYPFLPFQLASNPWGCTLALCEQRLAHQPITWKVLFSLVVLTQLHDFHGSLIIAYYYIFWRETMVFLTSLLGSGAYELAISDYICIQLNSFPLNWSAHHIFSSLLVSLNLVAICKDTVIKWFSIGLKLLFGV